MNTSEIRDKLLEQRTLYQQSLEASRKAVEQMRESLAGISDDTVQKLLNDGIDIRQIMTFDLERMKTDMDYLNSCKEILSSVINKLFAYLEDSLCTKS